MSLPRNKDGFTYFEITRSVEVEDSPALSRFLTQARQVGATVLAPEIAAVINEEPAHDEGGLGAKLDEAGDISQPTGRITGIRSSRLRVYEPDDLRYALLHYRISPGLKYAGTFNRAAQRVNWDLEKPDEGPLQSTGRSEQVERRKNYKRPKGELYRQLLRHGLGFDVVNPDMPIAVSCNYISLHSDPDLTYTELALVPGAEQPTSLMLLQQSKMCLNRFHDYSIEAATLVGGIDHSIPFARLPADLIPDEQRALVKSLTKFMPVRLVLGGVESRHSIAQRSSADTRAN